MTKEIDQYIEQLQHRQKEPVQGIIAASALGRKATNLRDELEAPARQLRRGNADEAILALTRTLWDMDVRTTQRAAAAWALGQIGGLEPTRRILTRLDYLFVQRGARALGPTDQSSQDETSDVQGTMIEALARALDRSTVGRLNPDDRQQLRQICSALLERALTPEESDPDVSTALVTSLAKLALRAPSDLPLHTLPSLLNAPEPTQTLAEIGALTELIPTDQRDGVFNQLHDRQSDATLDAAFRKLEESRGQPYPPEKIRRLLHLAGQLWHAEQDTLLAGEHLWKRIHQSKTGADPSQIE